MLAAVGLALLLVRPLWDVDRNQGIALAGAAVVWAVAWVALRRLQPALALVLGVSSLSLAAVATADLLSGTSLALTWSAEALLLSSSPCGCAMRACRQPRSSTAPSPRRTCSSSMRRRS